MASISSHPSGYRVQLYVHGVRDSKIFRTKREATAWAAARESEIRTNNNTTDAERYSLRDALKKYSIEVSPKKKGHRWEVIRIEAFYSLLPVDTKLCDLSTSMLAKCRDDRLKTVKPGTVIREFTLLSDVLNVCRREWGWIKVNPLSDVRRPPSPPHRTRVITRHEIHAMLKIMGYTRKPVRSVSQACACIFLVALRTGMRAGEMCSLTWPLVFNDYVTVDGKTGVRNVAITRKAAKVIEQCREWDNELVFGIKPQTLDALFRKYRQKAGLDGFTFHDSRHTAATWIAQLLPVLDLCKMFGWTNPAMAMVYYNPTASDISKRLSTRH
jgi:integrase